MSTSARLSLVIVAVRELARARRFYDGAFGWALAVDVPGYIEYAPAVASVSDPETIRSCAADCSERFA